MGRFLNALLVLLVALGVGAYFAAFRAPQCEVSFPGKGTVLIVGVSSSLGGEIARHLLERGFTVLGTARRANKSIPAGVKTLAMDVTNTANVSHALGSLPALRAVVMCSGVADLGTPIEHLSLGHLSSSF